MSLDFKKVKEISIVKVVARYGVTLRFKGVWGSGFCPLPKHKKDAEDKTFSVNTEKNYWKCFSASCNEAAGCKGGDTINFVALMEGCSQLDAARKLTEWFFPEQEKTPQRIVEGSSKTNLQATSENSSSQVGVKYMQEVEAWFYALIVRGDQEEDCDYWARILKGVKTKLVESYRSGQKARAA